jgi:hypothetical protein
MFICVQFSFLMLYKNTFCIVELFSEYVQQTSHISESVINLYLEMYCKLVLFVRFATRVFLFMFKIRFPSV